MVALLNVCHIMRVLSFGLFCSVFESVLFFRVSASLFLLRNFSKSDRRKNGFDEGRGRGRGAEKKVNSTTEETRELTLFCRLFHGEFELIFGRSRRVWDRARPQSGWGGGGGGGRVGTVYQMTESAHANYRFVKLMSLF